MGIFETSRVKDKIGFTRETLAVDKGCDKNAQSDGIECEMPNQQTLKLSSGQGGRIYQQIRADAQG
jgi:hypothetical protein